MNRLPRHPSSPKVCENAPKNNRNTNRSKNTHFFLKEAAAVSLCETQQPGQTAAQLRYCHNNSKKEF